LSALIQDEEDADQKQRIVWRQQRRRWT